MLLKRSLLPHSAFITYRGVHSGERILLGLHIETECVGGTLRLFIIVINNELALV